jgi:O-antigen/teichoic acid export membrane protein
MVALFDAPGAENILRILGLAVIIQGFINVSVLYFQKEFIFWKFFMFQFLGTLLDFIVTVVAAFMLRSVWALAFGLIAGAIIRCLMSFVLVSYRPRLRFDRKKSRELFNFGRWVLGSSILGFLITQGDDIFVGGFLGATMLGFYQMAFRISSTPTIESTLIISRVSFPLFSKIQDNIPRLRDAFLKIFQLVNFLVIPMAGIIFILAPEFTELFLGRQWLPAVPAIQVLAFAGLIRSIIATIIPLFRAVGKPRLETKWQVIRLAAVLVIIYPLTSLYGITGTAISVLAGSFISGIGFCYEAVRIIDCRIKYFSKLIMLPVISTAAITLAIYGLKFLLDAGSFPGFFILAAAGIIIFLFINFLFDRFFNYRLRDLIREGFQSFIR